MCVGFGGQVMILVCVCGGGGASMYLYIVWRGDQAKFGK